MIKRIKIFLIKIKWVLRGGKSLKQVSRAINEERGLKIVHAKKKKVNNAHYASTKRHSIKHFRIL